MEAARKSANPSPTLRQPFADPLPTFSANPSLQAPLSVGPRHPFRDTVGNRLTQLSGTQFDKIATRYECCEVLSLCTSTGTLCQPKTPLGGYLFRLQDVEKQRERGKTKAKKGRKKKEGKAWKHEKPPQICVCVCFLAMFHYKIGKMKFLDKRYPPGGVSPIFVYCFSCHYLVELGLRQLGLPVPNTG